MHATKCPHPFSSCHLISLVWKTGCVHCLLIAFLEPFHPALCPYGLLQRTPLPSSFWLDLAERHQLEVRRVGRERGRSIYSPAPQVWVAAGWLSPLTSHHSSVRGSSSHTSCFLSQHPSSHYCPETLQT